MSLLLFEGPAGTGKTTRLVDTARIRLAEHPLLPEERALALTKFHGSRRRMEARLKGQHGLGCCVDCLTIDSFAWHLLRRWRGLVREMGAVPQQGAFQAITQVAGCLLQQSAVGAWVGRRYPLVIIDEMQDCKGGEIEILAGLAPHAHCICAADAFQDLSGDKESDVISWASRVGEAVTLSTVYRTQVSGLISAATALRDSTALTSDRGSGFEIRSAARAPMAGGSVSWCLQLWRDSPQIAIISPTRPGTSPFVDDLLRWMAYNKAKGRDNATAGPFSVSWEAGDEERRQEMETGLQVAVDPGTLVKCTELAERAHRLGAHDLGDWLLKQSNVGGRQDICIGEVREQISTIVQRRRAFGRNREGRRFALTVHQAKNREFDSVIVLWPLRMQKDSEQQRRLLYNAITRAKRRAIVIVEDPKGNRLSAPPFSGG